MSIWPRLHFCDWITWKTKWGLQDFVQFWILTKLSTSLNYTSVCGYWEMVISTYPSKEGHLGSEFCVKRSILTTRTYPCCVWFEQNIIQQNIDEFVSVLISGFKFKFYNDFFGRKWFSRVEPYAVWLLISWALCEYRILIGKLKNYSRILLTLSQIMWQCLEYFFKKKLIVWF